MEKKMIRPLQNKVIGGVCSALGAYLEIDPVIIRIFAVISLFVFFPLAFLAYLVLWIAVPQEKPGEKQDVPASAAAPAAASGKKGPGIVMSIFFAVLLILIGVAFLVPNSYLRIFDIASLLAAVFFIFIAGKLFYEMIAGKTYRIVALSAAFVTLTFGVIIILNRLNLYGFGIYIEYTKNLLPAVLIAVGIGLIFKNIKNKIPEMALVSILFIFIGAYSMVKAVSAEDPFGNMITRGFRMPRFGRWFSGRNLSSGPFSGSVAMPGGLKNISYRIENSAGNLEIEAADQAPGYTGTGVKPSIITNLSKEGYSLKFTSQASDTKLVLPDNIPSKMDLKISAGNVSADLEKAPVSEYTIEVSGGSIDLKTGKALKKMTIRNNIGNTSVRLPKQATIRIKVEQSVSHLEIPDEFSYEDGVYLYRGGDKIIEITASVNMGNLEFGF